MEKELTLSEELQNLLKARHEGKLTVGSLFDSMGDRGFGLALLITSLPSALPIPAAGYSTPFGILLMILAGQILLNFQSPWIPQWARKIQISEKLTSLMVNGVAAFFKRVEHLIHPRWIWLMNKGTRWVTGFVVFFMALLMALPIPGTNTAPAGVIFLTGVAMVEEDGVLLSLAILAGLGATVLYSAILALIFYFGASGVSEALQMLRQALGF